MIAAAGWSALEITLLLTTGLVVGRGALRTTLACVLACACLAVPLAMPADPTWLRSVMALASLFSVLRTIEVLRDAREHGAAMRMFAYVAPLDAFAISHAPPRLDARGLAHALVAMIVAALGFAIVWGAPIGPARWPTLTLGGTIALYAAMDGLSALDRALLRAVGIESPPVQDAPIQSRSVAEFWGRRWNRAVGGWLRKHCFAPLARRRRVRLAVLASFAASAVIHFWPVLVGAGPWPALAMGAFFFVQAGLVAIEVPLGVARWSAPAGHAWTVSVMLASSPLFIVPVLIVMGVR